MTARFSEFLVRDGALPLETVRVALGRQIVYGGALDTALLEMGALDESTVWGELSQASGLPVPEPALVDGGDPALGATFDLSRSARCRAVPVARRGDTLQLLCGDPIEERALQEASAELGLDLELFVVPEVRLRVARQLIYGQVVPPRFLRLLARMLGPEPVRRWADVHIPKAGLVASPGLQAALASEAAYVAPALAATAAPSAPPPDAVPESPPEAVTETDEIDRLCRVAADTRATGRIEALRALRPRLEHPRVRELAAAFRQQAGGDDDAAAAIAAVTAIGELRDRLAVVALIALVDSEDGDLAAAARQALVEITKQDFGANRRRWTSWWDAHGQEARADWLFGGLSHKVPEIRFAASEELWQVTGEYFGYHFDLPRREREEARARWQTWWTKNGHQRR
jgi:hypothetical protein